MYVFDCMLYENFKRGTGGTTKPGHSFNTLFGFSFMARVSVIIYFARKFKIHSKTILQRGKHSKNIQIKWLQHACL